MKQIRLFYSGSTILENGRMIKQRPLEQRVNDFCSSVNVVDVKLAEGAEDTTTVMVVYEAVAGDAIHA